MGGVGEVGVGEGGDNASGSTLASCSEEDVWKVTTPGFPLQVCEAREGKLGRRGEGSGAHPLPSWEPNPPPTHTPPAPDAKARLGRRKLTVSGFDPRPRKETAPKKQHNRTVAPKWQSRQHPGPFDPGGSEEGWGLGGGQAPWSSFHLCCLTQVSPHDASHPKLRGVGGGVSIVCIKYLQESGLPPEELRLGPPARPVVLPLSAASSFLQSLCGSHHHKVHAHFAALKCTKKFYLTKGSRPLTFLQILNYMFSWETVKK